MECYSRVIEIECGCVIYYMPRLNQSSKVCNRGHNNCYNPLRISLERGENEKYDCRCFPACDEISYSGTLSTAPLVPYPDPASDLRNYSKSTVLYEENKFFSPLCLSLLNQFIFNAFRREISVLQVFYDDNAFRSYVRDEFIGFTDFLCNNLRIRSFYTI